MDVALLEWRLEQARLAVELGFQLIAEQRAVVGEFEAFGYDAAGEQRRILRSFEEMQERHLENLDIAVEQLAAAFERKSA